MSERPVAARSSRAASSGRSVGAPQVLGCRGPTRIHLDARSRVSAGWGSWGEWVDYCDAIARNELTKVNLLIRGFGVRILGGAPPKRL